MTEKVKEWIKLVGQMIVYNNINGFNSEVIKIEKKLHTLFKEMSDEERKYLKERVNDRES
jgi:hypothetical protein